ncbi:helix-turn-helix domain-containing protein, partial [Streptomyces sp. NPDC057654]|uniref:helix-turn-helix domain-containing protein n=1 Tax=Streptomyces sp. NPDC057654 TaxID=3346196 RepID=UPI0036A59289
MGNQGSWQPGESHDLSAFLELLRRLKKRSGLSYRQLEARAAAAGDILPRSSVSQMLNRDLPPRPELLAAFVRACGEGDRVADWLDARDRVVGAHRARQSAAADAPDLPDLPDVSAVSAVSSAATAEAGGARMWLRRRRGRLTAIAVAAVVGALALVVALVTSPERQR